MVWASHWRWGNHVIFRLHSIHGVLLVHCRWLCRWLHCRWHRRLWVLCRWLQCRWRACFLQWSLAFRWLCPLLWISPPCSGDLPRSLPERLLISLNVNSNQIGAEMSGPILHSINIPNWPIKSAAMFSEMNVPVLVRILTKIVLSPLARPALWSSES